MPLVNCIADVALAAALPEDRGFAVPGLSAVLATTLVMTGVFAYLSVTTRSRPLAFWLGAWAATALRGTGELLTLLLGTSPLLDFGLDVTIILNCLLLLAGTRAFYDRNLPIGWWIVGVFAAATMSILRVVDAPFALVHLPSGLFLAVTLFHSAHILLRASEPQGIGRKIAGWGLLLTGFHLLDYPFLRPLPDVAPWGFIVAGGLSMTVAIGIVILHFERARDALRRSERRFGALFDNSSDGMFCARPDQRFVAVNPALVQLLGAPSAEALIADVRLSDLFPEGAAPSSNPRLLAVDPSLRPRRTYLRPDRTRVDLDITSWRVQDAAGQVVGYEGIVRDITRERAVQSRLFQARKLEAIGQLAGGIAHDFNNLLTVIGGCTTMLRHSVDPLERSELLDDIARAAERAADLTAKLLTFSRQRASESRRVDLGPVLGQLGSMLERLLGERVELKQTLPDEACIIDADVHLIEQTLLNLAVNARDAMPGGGTLRIDLARDGDLVTLSVADTGTGISPEALPHIFEPFFTTKDVGQGTGLGLATVYGAVTQLGGDIEVESEPGRGTRFTMRFPARSDLAVQTTAPSPDAAPTRRARLLLAEDEDAVRRLAARILRDAGHDVVPTGDGEEAWNTFEGSPGRFDAIVTDVVMPRLSGVGLAKRVREVQPDMPIIFVTGYPDRGDHGDGPLDATAALVEKPFTRRTLCRAVASALAGAQEVEAPVALAGPPQPALAKRVTSS
ncbi:MAG: PAS domain-containing sensor histidine kinase [Deltaproteobacteria bacterium]|nr:MAG: PAS domain-containing sensor histidine kinase [Deltaproteobacteria bacterium]